MALQSHANQQHTRIQGQKSPFSLAYAAKKREYRASESDLLKRRTL
jgi:hypothetical protein